MDVRAADEACSPGSLQGCSPRGKDTRPRDTSPRAVATATPPTTSTQARIPAAENLCAGDEAAAALVSKVLTTGEMEASQQPEEDLRQAIEFLVAHLGAAEPAKSMASIDSTGAADGVADDEERWRKEDMAVVAVRRLAIHHVLILEVLQCTRYSVRLSALLVAKAGYAGSATRVLHEWWHMDSSVHFM